MERFKLLRLLAVLIILSVLSLGWSTNARAALQVSFIFQPSPAELSVGEAGTWKVEINNPDQQDADNVTLTVTLPSDFTATYMTDDPYGTENYGPPMEWSGLKIPAGNKLELTYKARPNCGAASGELMAAEISPGGGTAQSDAVVIKFPWLRVTLRPLVQTLHLGDTADWTITVKNTGTGDLIDDTDVGVWLADTLGSSFTFTSISGPNAPANLSQPWKIGQRINVGDEISYTVTAVVSSCDATGLHNTIAGNYTVGHKECNPVDETASVIIDIRKPDVSLAVTPPTTISYCGPNSTTVDIVNAGTGPAKDFKIAMSGLLDDWNVSNITNGVTWNPGTGMFSLGGDLSGNSSFSFSFDIGPTGSPCHNLDYYLNDRPELLVFKPVYTDECGNDYAPPYVGPLDFSVDHTSIPHFQLSKTGPRAAARGETGLKYTLTVEYVAPTGSAAVAVTVVDDYPDSTQTGLTEGFTVADAAGGTDDGDVISWDLSISPGETWSRTITLNAPDDTCAPGHDYQNVLSLDIGEVKDCLDCPILMIGDPDDNGTPQPIATQNTFINQPDEIIEQSSKVASYPDSPSGVNVAEVCSNIEYKSCFTFSQTLAPASWNDILFTEAMTHQEFVSVDGVKVNDVDVPSSCYSYSTNSEGLLEINLSGLDTCGFPSPATGASLCVTYTLRAKEAACSFVDFSAIHLDHDTSACNAYHQGVVVTTGQSSLDLGTIHSPQVIDSCEIEEFRIDLNNSGACSSAFWDLYDTEITVQANGHYDLLIGDSNYPVVFYNMVRPDGTTISSFDPVFDNNNDTYSWNLGDLRHHTDRQSDGPQPYITFYMRRDCTSTPGTEDWGVTGRYHNRCENDDASATYRIPGRSRGGRILLLRQADLLLQMQPAIETAYTPYPEGQFTITNAGSGSAFGVDYAVTSNSGLEYNGYSVVSGVAPDDVQVIDLHNVVFHWDELFPNVQTRIKLKSHIIACDGLDIKGILTWCKSASGACQTKEIARYVRLPKNDLLIIGHTADNLDWCNEREDGSGAGGFTIAAKNSGDADVYHVHIREVLPPGLSYNNGSAVYSISSSYGNPSDTMDPVITVVSGHQELDWDLGGVLPVNTDSDHALAPGGEIEITFNVSFTDCAAAADYDSSDKKAVATGLFDMLCQAADDTPDSLSPPSDLNTRPVNPHIRLVKKGRNETQNLSWTRDTVAADPGDRIAWQITLNNIGNYPARHVKITDSLPDPGVFTIYVAGSGKLYKNGTYDSDLPDDWYSNGHVFPEITQSDRWRIDFATDIPTTCNATSGTNTATAEYGCCSSPPMHKTASDSVNLTTDPDFDNPGAQVTIGHEDWPVCGGEVVVTLTNIGGSALNDNIVITLDSHYVVSGYKGISIDSSQGRTFPPVDWHLFDGRKVVDLDASIIDEIRPDETVTVRLYAKIDRNDATGVCLVPPAAIENKVDFTFHSTCDPSNKYTRSNTDNFTPLRPELKLEITPSTQIIPEGGTAVWDITLTNEGGATADQVHLTYELDSGYSNPQDNQGASWSGNLADWTVGTITAGNSWTVHVTATVNSGPLAAHAHVTASCEESYCILIDKTLDAYVAAFSLEKSVDRADANVGELLTYHVTAVFSNTDEFQNVNIVDTLPPQVEYIGSQPWPSGGNTIGTITPAVGGDLSSGQTVTWSPANFHGKQTFDYEITARIRNDAANQSGTVLTNNAVTTFDILFTDGTTSTGFSLNRQAQTMVTEPKLGLTKSISPSTGLQAGDTVTITLTATNNGDGPAYNVSLNDLINDNNAKTDGIPDGVVDSNDVIVYNCTTIAAVTTPADFIYSISGTTPACRVDYEITGDNAIAAGASRTFSFTVQIAPTIVTGSDFINLATVSGWSLKPSDSLTEQIVYDRESYSNGSDSIASEKVEINDAKSLTATSEPSTTNRKVAIGEVAEYRLEYTFPAGETLEVTLRDRIPLGLGYIAGSATLDRDDSNITTTRNPGGINSNTPGTPVSVTLAQSTNKRILSLSLGTVTNNSGKTAHLILTLKCVARNSSGNNAGRRLTDRIQMRWQDAAGTNYTTQGNRVRMRVVEPIPEIVKTASPTSAEGGDTITFTVRLCNNATGNNAASTFDWVFKDDLPADYQNPQVINIDTETTGANAAAAFTGNLLEGTIDQLDPGECVTITYTAELIPGVTFGQAITNTAEFVTTSLPGDHGTGDATPGTPGTDTGERTGTGNINDLRGSDSASVNTNIPSITKDIITPQTWYAIADEETFKLTLGIPVGTTSNFVVTDTLPAGLVYVAGSQTVTPPAGFSSTNPPNFSWNPTTRELKWDFGDITKSTPAADLVITYNVKVENVQANQDGTNLTNSAVLNYGTSQSTGPVTQTMTVGEPNLYMEKTPQTTPVDLQAGNTLRYRVELWNNGHTTAYQMDWHDELPNLGPDNGLYNITNPALTIVSGDVYQNGTTTPLATADLVVSTTTGTDDTIALPTFSMTPGSHFYVEFDCQLMDLVVADETLTNTTAVAYASQVSGDNTSGVRDCENPPCDDDNSGILNNYGESAFHDFKVKAEISIVKTLVGGNDHFTIGEEFAYNLRTWVIEGVSPDVEVHDNIPTGLTLQNHQISTPGIGIISFSDPAYDTPAGNVEFDFGNVTNAANNDPTDDHFDVELTVKADNIAANQDGVIITNNALVRWSAGPDEHSQNVDITIIEPLLEVSKTVSPTIQARGDLVTYTVIAKHTSGTTSDAFDLVIKDVLPNGLTFISSTETNSGSGQNLEFHKASLLQGEQWQFTYTVRVDATATPGTLENSLELDWSSLGGADGGTHSGRNGSDCSQANPLNDYCDSDKVPVQVVAPEVKIQKTVYLGHDSGASCPGGELAVGVNGKTVTYCFTVTNTGDTYLDSFTIADSDLGITETDLTLVSGTTPLAPGQSLVYYYESAINGDLTNTAGVSATPIDTGGNPIPGASNVTDTDTAQVDEIGPQIELAKTVYLGHDSGASCPGIELVNGAIGTEITYCFTVTNTGDSYLNDITIIDSDLGINISDLTLVSGSQPLAPSGQLVYYFNSTITKDLLNTAQTSGNPTDSSGVDLPEVPDPNATDTAQVVVAQPDIDLQKTVYLGHDGGASCPGIELAQGVNGTAVTYCFVVTNTGDTYLDDVTLKDTQLGLDVNLTTTPLAPNGTLSYHFETTISRDLTNTAVTSGHPTDAHGNILPNLPNPTATDTASVDQVGPGIDIQKTVYLGHDGGASCPSASEHVIDSIGSDVTYCFTVTNTGDTYLNNITIDDADLGINITHLTPVSGSQPLAPAASLTFYYESTITRNLLNTARTSGKPSDSSGQILPGIPEPSAVDTAQVEVAQPGLTLSKTVYPRHDHGASCPGSTHITVGLITYTPPDCPPVTTPTDITYCFTVTNTGGTYLDKITIVDSQLGITETDMTLIGGTTPLAPGASLSLYYETQVVKDIVNTAEACGVAVDDHGNEIPGYPKPCDSATAEVIVDPSIPTLNEWGMIVLLFMTGLISFYYIRKRGDI